MKLYGFELSKDDRVHSESMGFGYVVGITKRAVMINHSGQTWRYNTKLIRSGCLQSDLSWHKKQSGLQIKGQEEQDKATHVLNTLSEALKENYGNG